MKIVILIIAHDNPYEYVEMQNNWRKYMHSHGEIKSYFIKGKKYDGQQEKIIVENDTLYINTDENFIPGILKKTIIAFKWAKKYLDFKYIFRTNLSSVVDLSKLYNFCITNNFNFAGAIGDDNGVRFASGAGFFVSKKCIRYIMQNKEKIDYETIDDVSLGKLLTPEFNIFSLNRIDIFHYNKKGISDQKIKELPIFHYRVKCYNQRHITLDNQIKLINLIYGV